VLKLHVVQAEFGDCFILKSSEAKKNSFILIDGSLFQMFEKYLKLTLQEPSHISNLDLIVKSY
jgi:hypothetical protein